MSESNGGGPPAAASAGLPASPRVRAQPFGATPSPAAPRPYAPPFGVHEVAQTHVLPFRRSGLGPHPVSTTGSLGRRSGQWTLEEQEYALHVSSLFMVGKVPNCPDGTTLRSLLATLLNSSPMRVSKKCGKEFSMGKRGYRHCQTLSVEAMDATIARRRVVVVVRALVRLAALAPRLARRARRPSCCPSRRRSTGPWGATSPSG